MQIVLYIVALLAILLLLAAGWALTLFSMPGAWLITVGTAIYAYLVPSTWRIDVSWPVVAAVLGLAVIGELVESLAVAVGAKRAGGSKRSAVLALLGSIGGGLVGGMLGLPIPVVGPIVAVILGAAFGATGGAMLGEQWKGRSADHGWEVGKAAFWGRLLGTLGKIITVSVMVALIVAALLF